MNIAILSARTGNGHIAVAKALKKSFEQDTERRVDVFEGFYESLNSSNEMMSEFYNLLQHRSKDLCKVFTELACLENAEKQERIYQSIYNGLEDFFGLNHYDIVVSTTPLINRYIIRYLKETAGYGHIRFYVVITDPYNPMYPGFDAVGADGYFCPNDTIRQLLSKAGVPESRIHVTGYPVHEDFYGRCPKEEYDSIRAEYLIPEHAFVTLVNSGANGATYYLKILEAMSKHLLENGGHLVFLCGNNRALYQIASRRYGERTDITILPFESKMYRLMKVVDLCITKPGANSVYECIASGTPLLVDGMNGFLYQESGVVKFLQESHFGEIFRSVDELQKQYEKIRLAYSSYLSRIEAESLDNGSQKIIDAIA